VQEHLTRRQLDREDRRIGGLLVPLLAEIFPSELPFIAAEVAEKALKDRSALEHALYEIIGEHIAEDTDRRPSAGCSRA